MARIGYLAMVLLLGFLGACSGGPRPVEPEPAPRGTPTGDPVTATIGPEGGSLTSADGVLTLEVPPGTVEAPTEFGIQPITNTARGLGSGYRLTPEGSTFPKPVRLTFHYAEADPIPRPTGSLGVAFQDAQGFWQAVRGVALDAAARTLTVSTDHLSDWALFEWLRLEPFAAKVKVNQSITLTVQACVQELDEESLVVPLLPECRPVNDRDEVILETPEVNGVVGGNAAVGTVRTEGFGVLTYTAPGQKPQANPVAVSIEVESLLALLVGGAPKVLLVSNVQVYDDLVQVHVVGTFSYVGWHIQSGVYADVQDRFEADLWLSSEPGGNGSYVDYIQNTPSTEANVRGQPGSEQWLCSIQLDGDYEHLTISSGLLWGEANKELHFGMLGRGTVPPVTVSVRMDDGGCFSTTYPGHSGEQQLVLFAVDLSRLQKPGDAYTAPDLLNLGWELRFERR